MQTTDIAFVAFVVCSLTLFVVVLGWASWDESRRTRSAGK